MSHSVGGSFFMPDGDRFERALRGPGWRRAYRLSFAGGSNDALCDALKTAVAAKLRKTLDPHYLREIPRAIHQALTGGSSFASFVDVLSKLHSEQSDFAGKLLAERSAQTVFIEFEPESRSANLTDVETRFSQELVERNVRNSFFAPAREGIACGNNRTAAEELEWEGNILSALGNDSKAMLKPVFRDPKASIRAPRRTTPQRHMTMEELNRGLIIER
jgi:hypothetical protein